MKAGGMGQLSLGPTRSPNVKAHCDKASFAAALATEHDEKSRWTPTRYHSYIFAHGDNTTNILEHEGRDKCTTNENHNQTNGFLKSRAKKNDEQIH